MLLLVLLLTSKLRYVEVLDAVRMRVHVQRYTYVSIRASVFVFVSEYGGLGPRAGHSVLF